jgi:hypothetical protein
LVVTEPVATFPARSAAVPTAADHVKFDAATPVAFPSGSVVIVRVTTAPDTDRLSVFVLVRVSHD